MSDEASTPGDGQGTKHQVVAYTEKSQIKHETRHIQLVREYGFHPRTKTTVEDGSLLPKKFEPFPQNMYGRPLEEIDTFIYEETFCVVSKRFQKNYIHRFTGTKSLFLFEPWSQTRRICVYLATNQYFDYVVMATILFNCIFLAMTETIEEAEYIFLAIYSCEMFIKIIAKGFVLNKYTYLRNPWNWLDFVVITSGYATIGMEVGNLAGLRTFRVLRALKTVSIMPGLKTIINALLHSFKQLAEVMTLTIFCLMVFALFALQVYMGELRNKCVKNLPQDWNVTDEEWKMWINDTDNWISDEEGTPTLCGNLTGARHCPSDYTCLCIGDNPNHGYTNFDNFMWSMLTTFQLITLDYWENVYNMILATSGPMSVSFFTVVVFFGSFYLINLMLAVVALAYEEEAEITNEERKKDLLDHRDDSTFSFDPSNITLKKLNKHKSYKKKIDSRKGVLLASYSRKKTRRRKKGATNGGNGCGNNGNNNINNSNNNINNSNNNINNNNNNNNQTRSVSPSPSPSPRHSCARPQALAIQRTRGVTCGPAPAMQNPNTLHPLGVNYRGQLLSTSRQASSNASEGGGGGFNRESSLDDSGVVDDHDDQDTGNEQQQLQPQQHPLHHHVQQTTTTTTTVELQREITPVTLALSSREVRIIKCNGDLDSLKNHSFYELHPEYLSQIVVLDDILDRNCDKCVQCCVDYEGWLQFQNCLYKVVKDPLFELAITLCIVLNTLFLALEHHGMSENVRQALDIGNKVFTSIFTFECIIKLMALSKDYFLCGWNIFDLIIVSASLVDIIFELVDGLSVLRGLRLLRVLKLAQSWTTMKVLLSIIISTIGALGNLTLILVIVIYIFAVIGMQLFSKDYTPDKFYPDPVPRWNFNDFFHSFMMIFRILCGEWIEPLWDCMRAEEKEGASTCFAIFLPTLVMGNFMVLNLFLALLLNSFNSEELKSKKEEVGEESKLARSFDRIRSIVRKKRMANKEKNENAKNSKLEQIVNEVIIRRRNDKQHYNIGIRVDDDDGQDDQDDDEDSGGGGDGGGGGGGGGGGISIKSRSKRSNRKKHITITTLGVPSQQQTAIYRHSYQESMNRPLSGSDFGYEIPLRDSTSYLHHKITETNLETLNRTTTTFNDKKQSSFNEDGEQTHNRVRSSKITSTGDRKILHQMSSGFGTQQNDSKDEPTYAESMELHTIGRTNSMETDDPEGGGTDGRGYVQQQLNRIDTMEHDSMDPLNSSADESYIKYQKSLLTRSPSYRKSIDEISLISKQSADDDNINSMEKLLNISVLNCKESSNLLFKKLPFKERLLEHSQISNQPITSAATLPLQQSGGGSMFAQNLNNIVLMPSTISEHSVNTLSNEQDALLTQSNLREELLNCEHKELFQFLSDDYDNSNNYFSDTVGYGSAFIDPDTESLILDDKYNTKLSDSITPPQQRRPQPPPSIPPLPKSYRGYEHADDNRQYNQSTVTACAAAAAAATTSSEPRKTSTSSIRSNLSYISNSVFYALEQRRGGSISEPVDCTSIQIDNPMDDHRYSTGTTTATTTRDTDNNNWRQNNERLGYQHEPQVRDVEFQNIIRNFEKELNEIKKTTIALNRGFSLPTNAPTTNTNIATMNRSNNEINDGGGDDDQIINTFNNKKNKIYSLDKCSSASYQHVMMAPTTTTTTTTDTINNVNNNQFLPKQRFSTNTTIEMTDSSQMGTDILASPSIVSGVDSRQTDHHHHRGNSVKLKRRSLEKQQKVDDGFNVSNEIRKICDQMQAPFSMIPPPAEGISIGSNTMRILSPSPKLRRKNNDFHTSIDRLKRTSLIERVDEHHDEENAAATGDKSLNHTITIQQRYQHQYPEQIYSEKLPRKYLATDLQLESLSLKSTGSYENLLFNRSTINQTDDGDGYDYGGCGVRCDRGTNEDDNNQEQKPQRGILNKNHNNAQNNDDEENHQQQQPMKNSGKLEKKDNKGNTISDKPWHCLVSYVDDLTVGGRRNSKGLYEDPMSYPSFGNKKPPKVPDDCFPLTCYERCPCFKMCLDTKWGIKWTQSRTAVVSVVDTPAFEWFVLVLIFASSITLCFEDIHLDANKTLKRILYWTNFAFSLIFVIEMVLKWMALGFTKYFTSFWTILDFIIVFVSVFSLLIEENENLRVLRSLRTLRALRPLRAISRWQGMRIVVNALMYAIPSIFNVLLVCLVFWLIFSIMGVQFFGGKFFKCLDEEGELLPIDIVNNHLECLAQNYTWINSKITFDHVGMGYLALLQVATFEGWMEVMADAVDARGVDLQPQREANLYAYIYFVIFIVCGSFFTLNLFIGVIIDNFNMLKKRYEGGVLEMFLTESQKHYYTAMKKLGRKKPQKVIKRPMNDILAMFYDLSNSRRFEIAIFVLIFLNMLTMGIEHYDQPHAVFFILEVSNAFFTTVFGLEAIVKIVGLRYHYFTVPWNVFDFLLVLASIFGILMEDVMIDLPISPTLLRVVRVFRIGRILRLIKAAKGIRKLLFALVVSLPALFNIGALLALITFIYAILGMSLFGHVRLQGALDDMVNFQTFGRSMQLLFRLMTSAGWNDVLESLMIQYPDCDPHFNNQANGDCGHPLLAITYFTSFIIISYMIVINMYIAIILENFNQAHQEEEIGIVEDDLEMFYIRWSKYDPHATQFISFAQVSDFLASLDPPLGIPKPNTVALVSFNLAIAAGNKIHCLDILHALVKHVLGHVEETDNFKQLQEQMDVKFKKQFPTRKELEIISSTRIWKREDKAARSIQNCWRDYLRMKKERERSPLSQEDEHTQTSSPGGWHSKLSALNFLHLQVHRRGTATSSRASSRKSSRASDASDLSELAGPWLNLPLMLVGGANDIMKDLKNIEQDNEKKETNIDNATNGSKTPRRRSFYNFFLRHQDAVDDCSTSPSIGRKAAVSPSCTLQSLLHHSSSAALSTATSGVIDPEKSITLPIITTPTKSGSGPPPPQSKRATSFIRKKPPLERGLSAQSALRINKNALVEPSPTECPTAPGQQPASSGSTSSSSSSTAATRATTEPSRNATSIINPSKRQLHTDSLCSGSTSTLVHVLVHRESEEYHTDIEDEEDTKEKHKKSLANIKIPSPGYATRKSSIVSIDDNSVVVPMLSTVKIMVESPKEPPVIDFNILPLAVADEPSVIIDVNTPSPPPIIDYVYNNDEPAVVMGTESTIDTHQPLPLSTTTTPPPLIDNQLSSSQLINQTESIQSFPPLPPPQMYRDENDEMLDDGNGDRMSSAQNSNNTDTNNSNDKCS